ncbi:MAG: hypothetical protein N0C89_17305 [Candidatus Thiodiazotropha endolucinida]|nr:hypothetical protein [Candidatus Thiodiazotropha endolucinida]MCW4344268.1 hypothetical protein [Candidatus Thiodiazotropha endolucinida]
MKAWQLPCLLIQMGIQGGALPYIPYEVDLRETVMPSEIEAPAEL